MLLLDSSQEVLVLVAQSSDGQPAVNTSGISIADLSNPLVIATLALSAATGTASIAGAVPTFHRWTAFPMPQPRFRGAVPVLSLARTEELLNAADVQLLRTAEGRLTSAPGGMVVLEDAHGRLAP
jgi:hypothetical protein